MLKIGDKVKIVEHIAQYYPEWPKIGIVRNIFESARFPILAMFGRHSLVFFESELVKIEEVKKEDLM